MPKLILPEGYSGNVIKPNTPSRYFPSFGLRIKPRQEATRNQLTSLLECLEELTDRFGMIDLTGVNLGARGKVLGYGLQGREQFWHQDGGRYQILYYPPDEPRRDVTTLFAPADVILPKIETYMREEKRRFEIWRQYVLPHMNTGGNFKKNRNGNSRNGPHNLLSHLRREHHLRYLGIFSGKQFLKKQREGVVRKHWKVPSVVILKNQPDTRKGDDCVLHAVLEYGGSRHYGGRVWPTTQLDELSAVMQENIEAQSFVHAASMQR